MVDLYRNRRYNFEIINVKYLKLINMILKFMSSYHSGLEN